MLPRLTPSSALRRTSRFISSARGVVAMACLTAIMGCGKTEPERVAVFPAAGKVTFKGEPTVGAVVTLHPKAPLEKVPTPRASVGTDGSFKITTFNSADGAPEGEYVLTVSWYKPVKVGPDMTSGPNVIPAKYTNAQTSDIVVKIAAGDNTLDPIQLK